jgi:hypothetical protein
MSQDLLTCHKSNSSQIDHEIPFSSSLYPAKDTCFHTDNFQFPCDSVPSQSIQSTAHYQWFQNCYTYLFSNTKCKYVCQTKHWACNVNGIYPDETVKYILTKQWEARQYMGKYYITHSYHIMKTGAFHSTYQYFNF